MLLNTKFIRVWAAIAVFGCVLTACSPIDMVNSEGSLPAQGYPVPETPLPTDSAIIGGGDPTEVVDSSWERLFPTPSKTDLAALSVVEAASVPPTPKKANAAIESETIRIGHLISLRFIVEVNEKKVQLGDDTGTARWGALGARSFAWFFVCKPCKEIEDGLYVLDLETGKEAKISSDPLNLLGSVIVEEPWVVYYSLAEGEWVVLHAYNIDTTEDVILDSKLPFNLVAPKGELALNQGVVAWRGLSPNGRAFTLNWMDLEKRDTKTVTASEAANVGGLAVSKSLMVWIDDYWKVLDIRTEAMYTLPILPQGINRSNAERFSIVSNPVVFDNRVYWSVTVDKVQQDLSVQVGK